MKKTLAIVASALALTFLSSGVLAGCNANSSASAATAGKNTSKKVETTVNRLEKLEDKDFGFPVVFGGDFFLNEKESAASHCPPGVDCGPVTRARVGNGKDSYKHKHFNRNRLNENSEARTTFLDKFDNLFLICADISAANTKCNDKANAIKEENRQLRDLSAEMRKASKKSKDTYARFNHSNRELNESVTKLNRDRNSIKSRVKTNKQDKGGSLNVDSMTTRKLVIMNKLENRLRLLEDTHAKMVRINESLRIAMDKKPAQDSVAEQPKPQPKPEKVVQVADAQQPVVNKPEDPGMWTRPTNDAVVRARKRYPQTNPTQNPIVRISGEVETPTYQTL
jgi:hypothetical protein